MPEHHRYLRGLRSWVGYRQVGIPVERAARHSGRPKYNVLKLLGLAADGVVAFSIVPLRAAALLGVAVTALSILYAIYQVLAKYLLHQSPRGYTSLTVLITFLSGFNLLFIGIIGEYVGRIYEEIKARPQYVVSKVIRQRIIDRRQKRQAVSGA
jgi:dolichol-phosphate mannosyltransferase